MAVQPKYIVALDQGTTSSRAIVFDYQGVIVSDAQREFKQIYPQAGWVEHDPLEIYASQSATLTEALAKVGIHGDEIAAIGITNQRETTIVWNKLTGKPVYNAIVWQCRRTTSVCDKLTASGAQITVKNKTGLVLDPYFSATKIQWILDNVEGAREQADKGELLFGTIDSWLIWNMTEGRVHATDYTNASRTMLFNIDDRVWDEELLTLFGVPKSMLPEVRSSAAHYGEANIGGYSIPIFGVAGDQQAALFGQECTQAGQAKNTYGTGCFLLMNTGLKRVDSTHGLLTTLACDALGEPSYALEGSVFMGGASIQWLRDELKLIDSAQQSETMARKVNSANGVYVVPAFTGLGAPYWDAHARGTIVGLTRGVNANHIVRATLESIAYQSKDVLDAMQADSGLMLAHLKVDGGAVQNDFLMQFQADVLGTPVLRPQVSELTALGAARLAALGSKAWDNLQSINSQSTPIDVFNPSQDEQKQTSRYKGWKRAVKCAQMWASLEDDE
ncbi:glycerol kinase [Vibrio ichthyoenteri ATCC 700023]|uniref:Glycerol kinase n=1 Tax=Vibrio ichthyoenteri ATCC 700023 TaxID=870968 RepID=F9RXP7_9VIBR|nr:glycerol kinase GlpK [Vibrio ichthyoenteri]EGU47776.1 glycerol kinase [Vibrio ichthyoenteri ATCC 700023]